MKMILHLLTIALLTLPTLGKDYQLQTLETAHSLFRSATNSTGYAEAAQQYEYLVYEENIRNGQLFYTLGNSWFMAGNTGRAILNYRRAEQYMPNNPDLKHNLKTARELRTDLIPEKELHPLADKLLGWHLKISIGFRWWLFALVWMVFWSFWLWMTRSTRKDVRISVAVTGIISIILLSSLTTESIMKYKEQSGVVTAKEIIARKGDGAIYAPAFLEPLHSGTEFQRLEVRGKWWHIRLADGQACWIPSTAGETIALAGK